MRLRRPREVPLVDEDVQRHRGHLGALHPAQRAGGQVARVGVRSFHAGVDGVEQGPGQEDLAAHRHRDRPGQAQRNRADGPHVARNVVAHQPVAAGHGPGQQPLLVVQHDRGAVDLLLRHVGQAPAAGLLGISGSRRPAPRRCRPCPGSAPGRCGALRAAPGSGRCPPAGWGSPRWPARGAASPAPGGGRTAGRIPGRSPTGGPARSTRAGSAAAARGGARPPAWGYSTYWTKASRKPRARNWYSRVPLSSRFSGPISTLYSGAAPGGGGQDLHRIAGVGGDLARPASPPGRAWNRRPAAGRRISAPGPKRPPWVPPRRWRAARQWRALPPRETVR